jgi:branched-subunit amino acid transport protein
MIWFLMVTTGIFTFGTRFIMLSRVVGRKLPAWLAEALNFVPIAVLTAIIVPAVLIDPASQNFSILGNPRLLAALIAIAVALITRQVITTIGAGLATLWALKWLA